MGNYIFFMKTIKKRSDCPISCTLDVFGDKWSFLIIRDLLFRKESTYGDFLKSAEGIATNILATRLVTLEENKIILIKFMNFLIFRDFSIIFMNF